MGTKIYLSSPHMSDEAYEQEYVKKAFDTNWIAPLGENVDEFENEIKKYIGEDKEVLAMSSGTSAIHMALKYIGVKAGDIVFCSSLTFAASCNPIVYLGATPVFVDCCPETWNMSVRALEKAFQKYKPKAVVAVNLYGQSCDYDKIRELCEIYECPIVEDAAESLGALYKGRQTGTFGNFGAFSFNGNKIITTSGGGMLVCPDKETKGKIKKWITQSRENERFYEHKELGYNYRMSNVCAGIGRGQMKVLEKRIEQKTNIFKKYQKAFDDIEEINMMPVDECGTPNFWLSCITLKRKRPLEIIEKLEKENIESRHIWKPMHMQPIYKECDYFMHETDVAKEIFETGICLPSDTKMTNEEIDKIIGIVKDMF